MSSPRDFQPIQGYPDQEWNANIRSEYGQNWIFLGCVIALLVVFIAFIMILIKCFAKLFRIERAPTHPPSLSTKRPNPVRMVWSTLWDQPLPPGNFRSQAGFHSASSTRRLDSEHASLYMGEM